MRQDFLHATVGKVPTPVFRLGLSASYRPGKQAVYAAINEGVNYLFCFGIDTQMTAVLRDVLSRNRERYVVATGAYNYIWTWQNLRRALEKRLRQLRTDYIDVFHFLGVIRAKEMTPRVWDELNALREDRRVGAISISTHDRKFAGELASRGALDAMMVRYNAAHRGAEDDIFPHLAAHRPGVVSFTATRWRLLLRRPRGWPKDAPVPNAGMCYRFVLSNPDVDVCMTAPSNAKQLRENLAAVREGPLAAEEMQFMRQFGDAVYRQYKRLG
ncbi:MAG TPA: aldo/keto reductase [Bryobacteraceae bacterium]|nr:aldo/keto reductase [Bryobacteraceae bacterium]